MGLVLILAAGYTVLSIYLNSTAFRHTVMQQVNAALDGRISLQGHTLALHAMRLELHGVQLNNAQGRSLARIEQVHLRLYWPALLHRTLHIKSLVLDKAEVNFHYDQSDRLQLVMPRSPSRPSDDNRTETQPWAVRIDDFKLRQGEIDFQRASKGWSGQLKGLAIAAQLDSRNAAGQVRLSAELLKWRQPETAFTLPTVQATATMEDNQPVSLSIQTPQSKLSVKGRIDLDATAPLLDMTADLKVDPAEFAPWLPASWEIKGPIQASLTSKGSLDDPTVTLKAAWDGAQAMGVTMDQVAADLRLHQRKFTLNRLHSRGHWGLMDITGIVDMKPVFGDRMDLANARWEDLVYELKLNGEDLRLDRLEKIPFPVGGTFQLQAQMTGSGLAAPGAAGEGRIALQATGITPRPGAPEAEGRLTAEITRNGDTFNLKRLQAVMDENTLEADARINITNRTIEQAQARLQWAQLEALGAWLGLQLPSGSGLLNLSCQGPFRQPAAQGDILVNAIKVGAYPLGRLVASARLDRQGMVKVNRAVLENQGSLIEGNGRIALFRPDGSLHKDPSLNADLAFQHLSPSDFGWPELGKSKFNGRLHLGGSLQRPSGTVTLDESDVEWGGFSGQAKAQAHWEDNRLTVSDLNLYKSASSIHLKGDAIWNRQEDGTFSGGPRIDARIEGRRISLQDFFPDYAGTIQLTGEVSGPSSDLNGGFEVSGTDLEALGQALHHLNIKGRLSDRKLHWDTLEIAVAEGQQFTSQGWFAFDRRFSLTMAADDIELAHVAALQRAYPVDGRLNLQLTASGSVDDPQMKAEATIGNPRLNQQPWEDFLLSAHLRDHRLKLDADLNFDLASEYRIDNGDFNLQANFNQSDLTPYLAVWAGSDWAGVLSGRLEAKGNRNQPEKIQGVLDLENAELVHQKRRILSAAHVSARIDNGRLEIPASRIALLENGYVNLSAEGRWSSKLKVESDGRFPLAALAPFVNTLEDAQGEINFKVLAQGPLDAMQWRARADLLETGFEIPGLVQRVEDLNGGLELTPGRLKVEKLSGDLSGGRFILDGQLQLKEWRPMGGQLALNAQALPLQWPDTMDVVINGDLLYKGSAETPSLSGRLILLEGSYYKDVKLNLLSTVTQTRRAVPVPTTYAVPDAVADTTLNVAVTHRYPLLVDNNVANLQIAPDLKLTGNLARPILSGRAEVVEGDVIFRRKSFEVKRGVVDFINPYKIEPNLDIVAAADIRQWQVSLSLSGTPDQMVFKLSSNPPASENDILSLILLGRTGTELVQGEGGSRQTTRQMLAALVATAWGEDVKKRSGVDILEVETGGGGDQQSADRVQVTVGKRLSRRLTLKYEVESGSEEVVQRAVSEYRFLEHLLASGFQDSTGGYGGELVFRIEF